MIINIEKFLQPISPALACGNDYSFSYEFDKINQAKRQDDTSLSQGEWATSFKVADWELVINLCLDLLENKTKDIRVLIWLTEALVNTQSYLGLQTAFEIFSGLAEKWWNELYPNDYEIKIGCLFGYVNYITDAICNIKITQDSYENFSVNDYEEAQQLELILIEKPDFRLEISNTKPTLQKFLSSQKQTPVAFYTTLYENFTNSQLAWKNLAELIDKKAGMDAPAFSPVFENFDKALRVINKLCKEAGTINNSAKKIDEPPVPEVKENIISNNNSQLPVSFGKTIDEEPLNLNQEINSRDQAILLLREVANFFQRTEPHSPAAYLANKAANWANMPLHEWLKLVIHDSNSLNHVEELLGIISKENSSS